jgi:hypothetical protein
MRTKHGSFGLSEFLMSLAVVLFFLAALGSIVGRATPWPWYTASLIAAGLFCWSLSEMLP